MADGLVQKIYQVIYATLGDIVVSAESIINVDDNIINVSGDDVIASGGQTSPLESLGASASAGGLSRVFESLPTEPTNINVNTLIQIYQDGINQVSSFLNQFPESSKRAVELTTDAGPRWSSFSFRGPLENLTELIQDGRKKLDTIKRMLVAAQRVLQSVRSIIQWLKRWLSFWEDALKAFMKLLAQLIERIVDDLKSTGVYFLDMTTYHFEETSKEFDNVYFTGAWWDKEWTADEISQMESNSGNMFDKDKNTKSDKDQKKSKEGQSFINLYTDITTTFDELTQWDTKQKNDVLEKIFSYKMETYNEFIDRICFHFTDTSDFPHPELDFNTNKSSVYNLQTAEGYTALSDRLTSGTVRTEWSMLFSKDGGLKNLRTGPPDFGPNGKLWVSVVAVAFPDITQILKLLWLLVGKGGSDNWGLLGSIFPDLVEIAKQAASVYDQIGNPFSRVTVSSKRIAKEPESKWPYWIGVTANQLFGFVWDYVDELLNYLKTFTVEVDRSILDTIEKTLNSTIQFINKLIKIVKTIDQILEFLMLLLNIPTFSILSFESSTGTYGAVQSIKNSIGFFENQYEDIKDVLVVKENFERNLHFQLTQERHRDTFVHSENFEYANGTDYTIYFVNKQFTMWKERYTVLKNIYNYVLRYNMLTNLKQYFKNKDLLDEAEEQLAYWIGEKQRLIDISAPLNEINAAQNQIDYWDGKVTYYTNEISDFEIEWSDHFEMIRGYKQGTCNVTLGDFKLINPKDVTLQPLGSTYVGYKIQSNVFEFGESIITGYATDGTNFWYTVQNEILQTGTNVEFYIVGGVTGYLPDLPALTTQEQSAYDKSSPGDPDYVTYGVIVEFNNIIKSYIDYGEQAINDGFEKLEKMLINLENEAKNIYMSDSELMAAFPSSSVISSELIAFQNNSQPLRYYIMVIRNKETYTREFVEKQLEETEKEFDYRLNAAQMYDPDKKMMFAGFVVAFGYPDWFEADNWDELKREFKEDYEFFRLDKFIQNTKMQNSENYQKFNQSERQESGASWDKFKEFFK